jgi:hypothetical protein
MFNALVTGDDHTFFALVTDDFEFSGPLPVPVNAEGWFSISRLIALAFPTIQYNFQVTAEHGEQVHISTELTGRHTGMLDLTPVGMGVNPPTGKAFRNPVEAGVARVLDGRVASVRINPAEGGGVAGILTQLGIKMG